MSKVLEFRSTYRAKLERVNASGLDIKIAGTLDGMVDFAVTDSDSHRTYSISCEDARNISKALLAVADDIEKNCLYDRDALLMKGKF